jgi:hypothetical protein
LKLAKDEAEEVSRSQTMQGFEGHGKEFEFQVLGHWETSGNL